MIMLNQGPLNSETNAKSVGLYKKRTGWSFGGCEAGGDSRGDGDEKTSPAH